MRNQWYKNRWVTASLHVVAWVLWFYLPVLFRHNPEPGGKMDWNLVYNLPNFFLEACWVALFYLNGNFLVGRFMNRRRVGQYVGILALIFVGILLGTKFVFEINKKDGHFSLHHLPYFQIFPFLFMWAVSTVYRLVADRIKTDQLLKEKENENLKTELSFLRSQVSPHFLFNVLNNMVAMARLRSDKLEPSLIKLSGLMRYMLYESDESKVPLAREIEYLTSYIDLQRIRFGGDLQINLEIESVGDYHLIEPMLLIPFIENAFKHGTGMLLDPQIDVHLNVQGDTLHFQVHNKYNPDSTELKDRTSGIGLANVQRRLNLLYGQNYQLEIQKSGGWYTVSLQLKLS